MKVDLDNLKRLAEAATPGPWSTYMITMQNMCIRKMNKCGYEECEIARNVHHNNAAYIAAANPAAILELIRQRDELLAALKGVVDDIQALISESEGVTGLHRNGDIAPWDELVSGGRFERLTSLDDAVEAIARVEG